MNRLSRPECIGVDGCPGGWFAVSSRGEFQLFAAFNELLDWAGTAQIYIDIPIGLPETRPRTVEVSARALLTGKGSSVFSIPCRTAVYADDYETACQHNLAAFGRKLSLQSWYICRKIREVDTSIRQMPALAQQLCESHPELTFQLLNSNQPLRHSKKTQAGIDERISILADQLPDPQSLYDEASARYRRSQLGRDDIVDAMALMSLGRQDTMILEDDSGADEFGTPICMVLPRAATV